MNLDIIVPMIGILAIGAFAVIFSVYGDGLRNIEPFTVDKAKWQFDTAMTLYCEKTGKSVEELAEPDTDIIWDRASNHCSMFLTWAIMRDYCGSIHLSEEPESVEKVRQREMTGTEFFIKYCDCSLCREDFAECILPFVDSYYFSRYITDYCKLADKQLKKDPLTFSFCWADYDIVEKALDKAYRHWKIWERPVGKKKR
ncbi:MAG: hypothetical protein MJY56_02375 [Bacteroidales bacterium]|nr:hypothetical protein [Bacteroidales bacterium]